MSVTFDDMTADEPDTLMIVDALNLAFRYKHAGNYNFKDDYIKTVNSLKTSYKASKVIIACDMGSSSYRLAIHPEYKLTRKQKAESQTQEEKAAFTKFFEEFSRTMESMPFTLLRFDRCEADDIAAYIVNKRRRKNNIWLISTDKDWDLMICDSVSRFSYITRKEVRADNWHEHYEYEIEDHISVKCLMGESGESSDNIPGVIGIGPKKAHALVKEYGSTYDIIASLPIQSKYKHIANLNEFGANNLLRNYKLMDLLTHCDEALGKENCKAIDKVLEEYVD